MLGQPLVVVSFTQASKVKPVVGLRYGLLGTSI
jgi:hypothetical protein